MKDAALSFPSSFREIFFFFPLLLDDPRLLFRVVYARQETRVPLLPPLLSPSLLSPSSSVQHAGRPCRRRHFLSWSFLFSSSGWSRFTDEKMLKKSDGVVAIIPPPSPSFFLLFPPFQKLFFFSSFPPFICACAAK